MIDAPGFFSWLYADGGSLAINKAIICANRIEQLNAISPYQCAKKANESQDAIGHTILPHDDTFDPENLDDKTHKVDCFVHIAPDSGMSNHTAGDGTGTPTEPPNTASTPIYEPSTTSIATSPSGAPANIGEPVSRPEGTITGVFDSPDPNCKEGLKINRDLINNSFAAVASYLGYTEAQLRSCNPKAGISVMNGDVIYYGGAISTRAPGPDDHTAKPTEQCPRVYEIQSGDFLRVVAILFEVPLMTLMDCNPHLAGSNGDFGQIYIGDEVLMP
jgi:hypothetical protein